MSRSTFWYDEVFLFLDTGRLQPLPDGFEAVRDGEWWSSPPDVVRGEVLAVRDEPAATP